MDAQEEVLAEAKIWDYFYGFTEAHAMHCVVELGIAEIINNQRDKTITLSRLAASLPLKSVDKDRLSRFMCYLVHINLFTKQVAEEEEEERYGLTAEVQFLLKDHDGSMYLFLAPFRENSLLWRHIADSIDGKHTPFEKSYGMPIWEYMAANPEWYQMFDAAMASDTKHFMPHLIRGGESVFQGIESLVDVGGGSGTAIIEIAKAFPHINCTLFDLPHAIEGAAHYPGLALVPGDMFKAVPQANAILLKNVLHDWPDEECLAILKNCKEAIVGEGRKVIIVDVILDLNVEHEFSNARYFYDLEMMVMNGSKEKSEKHFKKLLDAAGFRHYEIIPIQAVQSVIVAYP